MLENVLFEGLLPGLQQAVRLLVPNFVRVWVGPLVRAVAKFGLVLFAPVSKIFCFFLLFSSSLGFLGGNGESSLVPLVGFTP